MAFHFSDCSRTSLFGTKGYNVTVRVFVAIRLSPQSIKPLVQAQEKIELAAPGVYGWSKLDSIHLTLYFLGEMDEPGVEKVREGLRDVQTEPMKLGWGGLVVLPSPEVPKILAAGVVGGGTALKAMQRKVHDVVFPYAENKETRAYFPHATIGRLKRGIPPSAKIVKRALSDFRLKDGKVEAVSKFELIHSELGAGPANYVVIEEYPVAIAAPEPIE